MFDHLLPPDGPWEGSPQLVLAGTQRALSASLVPKLSWIVPGNLSLRELLFLSALSPLQGPVQIPPVPTVLLPRVLQAAAAGFVVHSGLVNLSHSPALTGELGVAQEGTGIPKSFFKTDAHHQVQYWCLRDVGT